MEEPFLGIVNLIIANMLKSGHLVIADTLV